MSSDTWRPVSEWNSCGQRIVDPESGDDPRNRLRRRQRNDGELIELAADLHDAGRLLRGRRAIQELRIGRAVADLGRGHPGDHPVVRVDQQHERGIDAPAVFRECRADPVAIARDRHLPEAGVGRELPRALDQPLGIELEDPLEHAGAGDDLGAHRRAHARCAEHADHDQPADLDSDDHQQEQRQDPALEPSHREGRQGRQAHDRRRRQPHGIRGNRGRRHAGTSVGIAFAEASADPPAGIRIAIERGARSAVPPAGTLPRGGIRRFRHAGRATPGAATRARTAASPTPSTIIRWLHHRPQILSARAAARPDPADPRRHDLRATKQDSCRRMPDDRAKRATRRRALWRRAPTATHRPNEPPSRHRAASAPHDPREEAASSGFDAAVVPRRNRRDVLRRPIVEDRLRPIDDQPLRLLGTDPFLGGPACLRRAAAHDARAVRVGREDMHQAVVEHLPPEVLRALAEAAGEAAGGDLHPRAALARATEDLDSALDPRQSLGMRDHRHVSRRR